MARYEFNGQQIEAPDDMSPDEVVRLVSTPQQTPVAPPSQGEVLPDPQGERATVTQTNSYEYQASTGATVNPDDLSHNQDWLHASRVMYRKSTGQDWQGSDEDLASVGLNQMGWFNYNLPSMAVDAATIGNARPEEKKAFLYLMETYDNLGYSWGGTYRALKGIALDPTTYVGLSTFGLGAAAGQATKVASKEGLKQLLKVGVRTGIEGAVMGATTDAIRQDAEINAGGRKDFSYGQVAGAVALGGAAGFALGGAVDAAGTALRKEKPWDKFKVADAVPTSAEKPKEAPPLAEGVTGAKAPEKAAEGAPKPAGGVPEPTVKAADPHDVVLPEQVIEAKPKVEPEVKPTEDLAVKPEAEMSPADRIMKAVREASDESGARTFPETRAEVSEATKEATELLRSVKPEEIRETVEVLRREAVTPEQVLSLHNTFKNATDQLEAQARVLYSKFSAETDPVAKQALFEDLAKAKQLRDNVKAGDTALSSADGRTLGDRVGAFNTGERRDLSEENILAAKGIEFDKATPEQKAWAQHEYFDQYDKWTTAVKDSEAARKLTADITKAYEAGDKALAIQLTGEKRNLTDKLIKNEWESKGIASKSVDVAGKGVKYLNEFIISTIFTTSTLAVNTVPSVLKTIYRPALDFAMRGPADYAAFRQMTSTYMTMYQSIGFAWDAAIAAFRYERALLSTEPNKLLGDEAAFGGLFGRTLRTFPRMINATDEFFSQINYRGFVVGNAVADAVEEGLANKMGKAELEKYIKAEAEAASKHMFTHDINAPQVIDFLRDRGMDRGLTGAKLETWVMTQLDRDKDLFRTALDQSGKDYADDLLFKRKFSGENMPSRMAAGYEKFVNDNPIMRPLGQLFFRTPVRVFEEGLRMTPGLNLMAPKMLGDLMGKNGEAAMVKAQGQMMLSYAMASWAMAQYAAGNLTSGGPTDYKQKRTKEDGGKWQPYSLRVGEQNISLRNLDPWGTLFKIVPNVLDRMAELSYRKAQGEFVENKEKEALAWMSVAVGSTASAIADANLMSGVAELEKLRKGIMDPEHNDMTFTRFIASKAQLLVPNQYAKLMQQGDNNMMNDPVTVEQYFRAKINPSDPRVPKQYDVLGIPRRVANPTGVLTGLNMANNEALKRGHSEKELAVIQEIATLETASGKSLGVWPAKSSEFGLNGQDLRTIPTKSGKSYYDRLQEIYRGMPVTQSLYSALVANKGGTIGTRETPGSRVEIAQDIIKSFREAAMTRLYTEESGMREEYIKSLKQEGAAYSGKLDSKPAFYQ